MALGGFGRCATPLQYRIALPPFESNVLIGPRTARSSHAATRAAREASLKLCLSTGAEADVTSFGAARGSSSSVVHDIARGACSVSVRVRTVRRGGDRAALRYR